MGAGGSIVELESFELESSGLDAGRALVPSSGPGAVEPADGSSEIDGSALLGGASVFIGGGSEFTFVDGNSGVLDGAGAAVVLPGSAEVSEEVIAPVPVAAAGTLEGAVVDGVTAAVVLGVELGNDVVPGPGAVASDESELAASSPLHAANSNAQPVTKKEERAMD